MRLNARLATKGHMEKAELEFEEVFVLVARIETIRAIVTLTIQGDLEIHDLNVKSTFFYGEIKEDTYVNQLEGYIHNDQEA